MTVNSSREIGIGALKITAVKTFLIKRGLIDSAPGMRKFYIKCPNFKELALLAWEEMELSGKAI